MCWYTLIWYIVCDMWWYTLTWFVLYDICWKTLSWFGMFYSRVWLTSSGGFTGQIQLIAWDAAMSLLSLNEWSRLKIAKHHLTKQYSIWEKNAGSREKKNAEKRTQEAVFQHSSLVNVLMLLKYWRPSPIRSQNNRHHVLISSNFSWANFSWAAKPWLQNKYNLCDFFS